MTATVYANGVIHTMDPAAGTVPAMAVRGDRIVAAGSTEECRDRAGTGFAEVDLGGNAVVPGLTDGHIHLAQYARSVDGVDLRRARDLDEALDLVRRHTETLEPGGWVTGGRWDCNRWPVPVMPDRRSLDAVTGGHPAVLPTIDGHTVWANSAALALVGITDSTPDPVGGRIERDTDGVATGILREEAAEPVRALADRAARAALPSQITAAATRLLAHGMTGVHDIDGMDALDAFRTLHADHALQIRVHKLLPRTALADAIDAGWATGDGDRWLSIGPVKLFTDGALGSHSCLMSRGFVTEPDNRGIAVTPAPELQALVRQASSAGIAVAAHAIGDEANHVLLDAFESVIDRVRARRLRFRVEHAQFIRPADIPRFSRLGVIASMQPTHCTSDITLNDTLLDDAALHRYAWRTLLDSGAALSFGSDAPVEDPNAWLGVHAAVTRQRVDGSPAGGWQPGERISVAEAIRAYTSGAAFASCEEHLKGRLVPGMLADFAVLNQDPFTIAVDAIPTTRATTTVVGGRAAWAA